MSYFNRGHPVVFEFKITKKKKKKSFNVTVKTQQWCVNISVLLWQHVSVFLDHLQASIHRYEVPPPNVNYSTSPT